MDNSFLDLYKKQRQNSIHVIQDATTIDYKELFINNDVPKNIDYLQIDLEPGNGSTLKALEKIDKEVLNDYKFAVITFEHDIYRNNKNENLFNVTRDKSREIFKRRGYVCVFKDISNDTNPYEDWYVHPELVDMDYIEKLIEKNSSNYMNYGLLTVNIEKILKYNDISYS